MKLFRIIFLTIFLAISVKHLNAKVVMVSNSQDTLRMCYNASSPVSVALGVITFQETAVGDFGNSNVGPSPTYIRSFTMEAE
jgi:hypothetical protein